MGEKKRNFEQELAESIKDGRAYKRGERTLRTFTYAKVSSPAEIRNRLNLSQEAFAGLLGISVRTLQAWESGRREPRGPAKVLLRIAEQHPEVFLDVS